MNDKKLTDKELEVTPDDKIVAKMKKMVFVDDEDVIRTAIKLARQDERKQIVRWVEIKIKDILRDKDYYNQFYGADILVRTLKGIIDGIECCAWEDVDDSLFKKRVVKGV